MKLYYVFWKIKSQRGKRSYLGRLFTDYLEANLFQEELMEKGYEGEAVAGVNLVIGEK